MNIRHVDVYKDVNQDARREFQSEIQSIKSQITTKRKQIEEVEDLMITDRTNAERYSRILKRYENEVCELENKVEMLETLNRKDIKPKLRYVISLINNAVMYIRDTPVKVKIKLIVSMLPEKLVFDGKSYRTFSVSRGQSRTCSDYAEARKRTLKANQKTEPSA